MRIGIQTWGSHGDVRPFLALAEGLQRAGHEVHLVITCVDSKDYADATSAAGVRIETVATPAIPPEEGDRIGETILAERDPVKQTATIFRLAMAPVEAEMFAAAERLAAASDLLVGHHIHYPLRIAAERANKPFVSVLLSHSTVPSAHSFPLRLPFGTAGNRALWWLTKRMLNRALLHYPNALRRRLGMPPVRDLIEDTWLSPHLSLLAVSPTLCERQPDWPSSVQVCGFLDMPNIAVEGTVPPELDAFLAAGERPVYMTLGSWMPPTPDWQRITLELLTDAARLAGCRAIIQAPIAAECGFVSDERFLFVSAAPHHLVFPRCAAVLHHGGAGTTQSATLAGRPSIVVAHIAEQEHWGKELQRLGAGGKPIHRRKATAKKLARMIGAVLTSPSMERSAQQLATRMREEHGVRRAVELIGR